MPWMLPRLFGRRRSPSDGGRMPDVGQPPPDAEPMVEPRLQDIGSGSYELPLPDDAGEGPEADKGSP